MKADAAKTGSITQAREKGPRDLQNYNNLLRVKNFRPTHPPGGLGAAFVQDTEEGGYASMYPQAKKIQKYLIKIQSINRLYKCPLNGGRGRKRFFPPTKYIQ